MMSQKLISKIHYLGYTRLFTNRTDHDKKQRVPNKVNSFFPLLSPQFRFRIPIALISYHNRSLTRLVIEKTSNIGVHGTCFLMWYDYYI